MSETKGKSSSVSSLSVSSSCPLSELKRPSNDQQAIPTAMIKANRKLTLGEIQEVHDCTLLDNKLAFIVTLRATNAIAKVYKNDINTNSLRHAVPFSNVCNKYGVKSVDDLEKKLIQEISSSANTNTNPPNTNRSMSTSTKGGNNNGNIIEISCDSNTSLKQLKNIANVVNKTTQQSPQINSISSKQSMDIEAEPSDDNDSEYQQDAASKSPEKITYNLRSKKRKFRELNEKSNNTSSTSKVSKVSKPQQPPKPSKPKEEVNVDKDIVDLTPNESDDDTASINNVHNNTNNKNIGNNNRIKRPRFLRPIPNTTHIGPLSSPTKVMNNLRKLNIDGSKHQTSSAPNTPILNGNRSTSSSLRSSSRPSTPVINLVNSPQVPAPLQFPQISLPQGQFTLLGPLKFPSHPTTNTATTTNGNIQQLNRINTVNTNRLNGVNGLSANSLQQLQQLIMLQKRTSESNFGKKTNNNNVQPIQQPLPRLEAENDEKSSSNTTDGSNASVQIIEDDVNSNDNNSTIQEPPAKKQKLLNGSAKHKNIKNGQITGDKAALSAQTLGEQFWSERLRLDGILNTHKACSKKMNNLSSMENWTHVIRTLQSQRLELLKVQQSICIQWQNYHIEANRYNQQMNNIIKQNQPKQKQYLTLKHKIEDYKKQITEIYEKISKLSVKRKVLEKQMQSANKQFTMTKLGINQVNNTAKQFKKFINDRKEKAVKLVEFMKTIDVISKQYIESVEIMQEKVHEFEPGYDNWNSGEVVTWFENIDKGLLNKSQAFRKFKTNLISNGVCGKDLCNLNDFSLKMMGLKDDKQRAFIIKHLNRLLIHSKQNIQHRPSMPLPALQEEDKISNDDNDNDEDEEMKQTNLDDNNDKHNKGKMDEDE